MTYRYCLVPGCSSTTVRNPEKRFINVPRKNDKIRKKWFAICKRYEGSMKTNFYCCEDHFNVDEDFANLIQHQLTGCPLRLKRGVLPSKFDCQRGGLSSYFVPKTCLKNPEEVQKKSDRSEMDERPFEIIAANIQVPALQNQPLNFHVPSSLPASQNWLGEYGFTVSFTQEQKNSKAWTYSKTTKKLYIRKDASCPINFSTNTLLPDDVFIRATAFYSSPDHLSEVVYRCNNHSTHDLHKGLVGAEHLLSCECTNAQYQIDPLTYRHSVVVPFENPPVGQDFSTFIYKFTCYGTCTGGPNRRPMMIVFTLEKDNEVIGRHRIDVKICAFPGRDQKYEDCIQTGTVYKVGDDLVQERSSEIVNLSDSMEFVRNVAFPVPKKVTVLPSNEGPYTIETDDLNCFEFIKQMKRFYEICERMKGLPPDISSALINFQQQQIKKEDS